MEKLKKTSFVAHTAYAYSTELKSTAWSLEIWSKTGLRKKEKKKKNKPQKQWAFEFSSLILFLEFLNLTRNKTVQWRNTSEFSSYLRHVSNVHLKKQAALGREKVGNNPNNGKRMILCKGQTWLNKSFKVLLEDICWNAIYPWHDIVSVRQKYLSQFTKSSSMSQANTQLSLRAWLSQSVTAISFPQMCQ